MSEKHILFKPGTNLTIHKLNSGEVSTIRQNIGKRIDVLFTEYEQNKYSILKQKELQRIKDNFINLLTFEIDQIIIQKTK